MNRARSLSWGSCQSRQSQEKQLRVGSSGVDAIQETSTRHDSNWACVMGKASALGRQWQAWDTAAATGMQVLKRGTPEGRLLPSKRPGKLSG